MVHVFYHYNNGVSKRGSHRRAFATRVQADGWICFMEKNFPKFQLDEVFDETNKSQ